MGISASSPSSVVTAKVWTGVGSLEFVFPELRNDKAEGGIDTLKAKPNFAVCLSGGGFRATICALGWVRALHDSGLLKHVRYMTSNSGGSWFNAAFSYQSKWPTETFLGAYVPPNDLTPEAAQQSATAEGSYAKVVTDAYFLQDLILELVNGVLGIGANRITERIELKSPAVAAVDTLNLMCGCNLLSEDSIARTRAWSEAVGKGFLRPFDLDDDDCTFAMHGDEMRLAKHAKGKIVTACRESTMPFPIIVGAVAAKNDPRQFYCYDFTPMYSGIPADIEVVADTGNFDLGCVLVENFALDAKRALKQLPIPCGAPSETDLETRWNVPLKQAAGISSSYIAQTMVDSKKQWQWELAGCPELHVFKGNDGSGGDMPFADGGGVDNLAVHAALRRNVKKLLVCNATPTDYMRFMTPLREEDFAASEYDLSGLFGAVPKGRGPTFGGGQVEDHVFNDHIQVFETSEWSHLLKKVSTSIATSGPVYVRMHLNVLPNKAQGIAGGYIAEVLFLFNSKNDVWQNKLPAAGSQWTKDNRDSFPFISTNKLDYGAELTGYLSNLATFNMLQIKSEVASLIGVVLDEPTMCSQSLPSCAQLLQFLGFSSIVCFLVDDVASERRSPDIETSLSIIECIRRGPQHPYIYGSLHRRNRIQDAACKAEVCQIQLGLHLPLATRCHQALQ